ncbi:MAG: type II toxin-antitoxin system RelE/ParE family toxin [Trichodesmium sp. St15_bin1_1]|jgi:mRNA interferase RelE/StbE|nr:type II toxin-antitoxin system RelE/ParE family toxin [Trichodesmium sp. MAG_R02]MDE5074992.1 type II toxin-antitoxin system RelE/ParE family toxin [Trichodesmium sp. St5_bin2_1]MDE5085501.1 type II toxin-antitoxin system RelE/ParE family toxin [Trichodesmium sp. St18_bin1]MDE5086905.1 type II toxin-antitoxin system RelE/ParE family toxin [Trichodesmium sp. St16_bin2-tuft]MDE5112365.1 type II toxin-antitoxin system RelE/ParE family toxin [Trichodesmium sp. St7_bin2_1]MDE5113265.1 type II to
MNIEFKKSFEKDLLKILDADLLTKIKKIIVEVEQAEKLTEVRNIKKLKGEENYYRIRVGDYRLGIKVNDGMVSLVRILHRKEIYRYFP